MRATVWLLAIVIATHSISAQADLIVNQPVALGTAVAATSSNLRFGVVATQVADDFIPTASFRITDVSWTGHYAAAAVPNDKPIVDFTFRLSTGKLPPAIPQISLEVPATYSLVGTFTEFNEPIYQFTAPITAPVQIRSGEKVWLSVMDSDDVTIADFCWLETASPSILGSALRFAELRVWGSVAGDYVFSVNGVLVPEPTTCLLLALGLMMPIRGRRW